MISKTEIQHYFESVIESNRDRIYRLCCAYVPDRDERNDVYQEVLVNIWKSLGRFEGRSHISTWIYRITVNTCLEFLRSDHRRKRLIDPRVQVESIDHADSPTEADEESEAAVRRLMECIGRLGSIERTLIMLSLEDVSMKEIGDILGISEGNVRVKLHRIKKQLKIMLEGNGNGTQ